MGNADKKEASKKSSSLQFTQEIFSILAEASQDEEARLTEVFRQLLALMQEFNNRAAKSAQSEALSPLLYEIEQIAYAWQREHSIMSNRWGREAMRALLLELEDNYCSLMSLDPVLWIPPGTDKEAAIEMQDLWHSITARAGNIQIISEDQNFISCIKFSIAKLLQKPYGRHILFELNQPQKGPDRIISIGESWKHVFKGQPGEIEWKEGSGVFAFLTVQNPKDRSFCRQENGVGVGTGSYVQITIAPEPFLVGLEGQPLYVPCFLTLGHELGHAYNILLGQRCDALVLPSGYPSDFARQRYWTNPEEFQNILLHENVLRAEHGLPQRMYHIPYHGLQIPQETQKFHDLMDQADTLRSALTDEITRSNFQARMDALAARQISLQSVDEDETDLVMMERLKELEKLNEELKQLIQELKAALQG